MIQLNIKQILQNKGKTAYWLAKKTGISPNNIGKICNGETKNTFVLTQWKSYVKHSNAKSKIYFYSQRTILNSTVLITIIQF